MNIKQLINFIQQPIIIILIGTITGIIIHGLFPVICLEPSYTLCALSILAVGIIALCIYQTCYTQIYLLVFLSIAFGFFRMSHQIGTYEYHAHKLLRPFQCISAYVKHITKRDHPYLPYKLTLHAQEGIMQDHTSLNLYPCIFDIYTKRKFCHAGDTILLKNVHAKPCIQKDFKKYLIKENIHSSLYMLNVNASILNHPAWSIDRAIESFQNNILQTVYRSTTIPTRSLFCSLFLGNRHEYKKTYGYISALCKRWGILHYLARSGLHLVACIMIWSIAMRFIPLSYVFKECILASIIFFYYLCSWSSISFMRAFTLYIYSRIALLSKRRIHFLYALCFIACIFLLVNPITLYFLDFQLSFLLTGALGLYQLLNRQK